MATCVNNDNGFARTCMCGVCKESLANKVSRQISFDEAVEIVASGLSTNGKIYRDDAASLISKELYAIPGTGCYLNTDATDLVMKHLYYRKESAKTTA